MTDDLICQTLPAVKCPSQKYKHFGKRMMGQEVFFCKQVIVLIMKDEELTRSLLNSGILCNNL